MSDLGRAATIRAFAAGARRDARDGKGGTPADLARARGHDDVMRLLAPR